MGEIDGGTLYPLLKKICLVWAAVALITFLLSPRSRDLRASTSRQTVLTPDRLPVRVVSLSPGFCFRRTL